MSIRISELPQTNEITDDDLLAVVDNNIDTTMKIEAKTIKDYNNKEILEEIDTINTTLETKQDTLVAGDNIEIDEENVISTPSYVAGDNIHIDENKVISAEYLAYDDTQIKQDIANLDNNKVDKVEGKDLSTNDFTNEYKDKVDNAIVYDDTEIRQEIANLDSSKVDKVEGKGLSSNDYTNEEKTKLSSLENYDDTEVKGDISDLQTNKADKTEIPDVSNFITSSVDNLVNYYKKSETYTQSEVNNLIGAIQQFHYEIVQTLPQTGATNILYLVPKTTTEIQNVYDEYVYANNGWEKIGDTQIDLSDYVTITMLNNALANYTTTTDLTTLLNGKVDKITGKSLSTNDFTNELKTKLEGLENYDDTEITSELENKVDKVTGKGLSTNDLTDELLNKINNVNGTSVLKVNTLSENLTPTSGETYRTNWNKVLSYFKNNPDGLVIFNSTITLEHHDTKIMYNTTEITDNTTTLRLVTVPYLKTNSTSETYYSTKIGNTYHCYDVSFNGDVVTTVNHRNASQDFRSSYYPKYVADLLLNLKQDTIQYSTMPTANSTTLGKVVQYIGTTDSTYTNGYFYQCVSDGATTPTYSWTRIDVQPSGSSIQVDTIPTASSTNLGNIVQYVGVSGNKYKKGYFYECYQTTSSNYSWRLVGTQGTQDRPYNLSLSSNLIIQDLLVGEYIVELNGYDILYRLQDPSGGGGYIYKSLDNLPTDIVTLHIVKELSYDNKIYAYFVQNDGNIQYIYDSVMLYDYVIENTLPSDIVKLTGSQTISGKKTFTTLPESSVAPTTNNQFTNKSYVDTAISNAIGTALGGSY